MSERIRRPSMKIHLSRITSEGIRQALSLEAGGLARLVETLAPDGEGISGQVEADLTLKNLQETIQITGTVRLALAMPCTLCLSPAQVERAEEVRVVQAPVEELRQMASDIELSTYEMDIDYFEGEEIDLAELVEEQALLMLPSTIYCRDDCQGLWARCGADLNDGACGCKPDSADHPFAAMKDFLPENSG